jgi:hypothetical protein
MCWRDLPGVQPERATMPSATRILSPPLWRYASSILQRPLETRYHVLAAALTLRRMALPAGMSTRRGLQTPARTHIHQHPRRNQYDTPSRLSREMPCSLLLAMSSSTGAIVPPTASTSSLIAFGAPGSGTGTPVAPDLTTAAASTTTPARAIMRCGNHG